MYIYYVVRPHSALDSMCPSNEFVSEIWAPIDVIIVAT